MAFDTHQFYHRPSAVIRARGPDAQVFLQGQFTQDLGKAAPGFCAYGLWLTQKGKVMGDSHALCLGPDDWLIVAQTLPAETLLSRLESYLIADDVLLDDETARWACVRIVGADTPALLQSLAWTFPESGSFSAAGEGYLFPSRSAEQPALEWLRPVDATELEGVPALTSAEAEWARVEAGFPAIPGEVGEGDLPNEAGLETSAVSYTKGCYLGQEVMARLKAMGQVRRRLVRLRGIGQMPPAGAELLCDGKRCGEFRGGVARDGAWVGFAMVSLLNYDRAKGISWNGEVLVAEELRNE